MIIRNIAIAGAGTMGAGIGQILAQHGYHIKLLDLTKTDLDRGRSTIQANIETLQAHDMITPEAIERIDRNISYTTAYEDVSEVDLVIEAIVEKLAIKQAFWTRVEPLVGPDTILASNTSGLSIDAMSETITKPERFIGMHFWNPPHIMPLVELIKGKQTTDEVVTRLETLCQRLGKVSVVVQKDVPGFIGNRLQFAVLREALHLLEAGIATAEDIDKAMRFGPGFRYPHLGPIETADLGGLDVFALISEYLNRELSDEKGVSARLQDKVLQGHLGTKTGRGFYDYPPDTLKQVLRQRDERLLAQLELSAKVNNNSL